MEEEQENQLSKITIGLMMVVALFYDLVQFGVNFIPAIGQIASALVAILAFCHFFLWFKMHGVSFVGIKKILTMGAGFLIELIPVLNMLPGWMVAVAGTIVLSRVPAAQMVAQAASGNVAGAVKGINASQGLTHAAQASTQAAAAKTAKPGPKRVKRPISIEEGKRSYHKKDDNGSFRQGLRDTMTDARSYFSERQSNTATSYAKKEPAANDHRLKYRGTLIENTEKRKAA